MVSKKEVCYESNSRNGSGCGDGRDEAGGATDHPRSPIRTRGGPAVMASLSQAKLRTLQKRGCPFLEEHHNPQRIKLDAHTGSLLNV